MRILILLLTFFSSLFAIETEPALINCIEGVPEGKICGSVDALSGHYVDVEVDLYVPGPDPLVLQRNYESSDFATGTKPGTWRLLSHCFLVAGEDKSGKGCVVKGEKHLQHIVYTGERLGSFICYVGWKNIQTPSTCALRIVGKNNGLTNCARGEIGARTFLKNNALTFFPTKECYELLTGDGTLKIYKVGKLPSQPLFASELLTTFSSFLQQAQIYHLVEEKLPSGNRITYTYDDSGNPITISAYSSKETSPFSQIIFTYEKNLCTATADDGRKVYYHFSDHLSDHLTKVECPDQPDLTYNYDAHGRLNKKSYPDGGFLEIGYDKNGQVSLLKDSDGQQANITYQKNQTKAILLTGIAKVYHHREKCLRAIDTLDSQGCLYKKECWHWENALLRFKTLEDEKQNINAVQAYVYDDRGNSIEECFYGNLTGKPQDPIHYKSDGLPNLEEKECHKKIFAYSNDKYNLVIKQGDCKGNSLVYVYKPNSNLVVSKYILEKDKIRKRYFFEYNEAGVKVQEIEDDGSDQSLKNTWGCGVSKQLITRIILNKKGFPITLEKTFCTYLNQKEILFQKQINYFDASCHLTRQEIWGTDDKLGYAIERSYDQKGNLITETDPAGQTTFYTYDACKRKLTEHAPYKNTLHKYEYDKKGRCIAIHENLDNLSFTRRIVYDVHGHKIAEIDRYGNQIDYSYDSFGRLIKTTFPTVQEGRSAFSYKYDYVDNCIEVIDPKGYMTKTAYNSRRLPTHIDYPDGSYELYKYDVEGSLHRQSTRDQTIYVFEYDYQGRLTTTERSTYSPNGSGSWIATTFNHYNAFHKISSKDEQSYYTLYKYDGAGRLIALIQPSHSGSDTEDSKARKQEFLYDSLNRLKTLKTWYGSNPTEFSIEAKEYDNLGQIIEERGEDALGQVFWKKEFKYDRAGNLIKTISYPYDQAIEQATFVFDGIGNIVSSEDADHRVNRTVFNYDHMNDLGQKVLKKILINPAGGSTEMIYDAPGRLSHLTQKDPTGEILLTREIVYDLNGNKCKEVTREKKKEFHIEWQFGPMNRVDVLKVGAGTPEEQITTFTYTSLGQLASRLDPGESKPIVYDYNRDGTLYKVFKEGDLSNRFSYDRKDNVTSAYSLGGIAIKREFDAYDQLIEEEFKDDVGTYHIKYAYDKMGRRTSITLPDGSSIQYGYDAFFPRFVNYVSSSGDAIYTHSYDSYDGNGQLIKESLFGFCGELENTYDLDGTKTGKKTDLIQEKLLTLGPLGEVLRMETILPESSFLKKFEYDSLYQLSKEPEHEYSYDFLRNRIAKDGKNYTLNSINQLLSDEINAYTYEGRVIKKENWSYRFDALNHLIQATQDKRQIDYSYDPFGRRLNRIQYEIKEKNRKKLTTDRFFHIGLEEIGRVDEGRILECKILGAYNEILGIIERGEFYVVSTDLQGNLVVLADPMTRELVGYSQWSAFGELLLSEGKRCSWGYQGKREDPETHLIYFGAREYDPIIGRWLTPDPAGFIDGPNLYQYTWNNPLSFSDHWGFSGHEDYFYGDVETHCFCERHRDCKRGGDFQNVNPEPYPSTPVYYGWEIPWNRSQPFDLTGFMLPELPKGQIGFVNGMDTERWEAIGHTLYISKLAGGYNIHAVHNATHKLLLNILCCWKELHEFVATAPVRRIEENWDRFFSNAGDKELYLQFCHSEGAILVRNALLEYPDHLRKRIIVIAIAPGAYIPREICYRPVHYVSARDFVPLFDKMGMKICQDTIVRLTPHPGANWPDHGFRSVTYQDDIIRELISYINMANKW